MQSGGIERKYLLHVPAVYDGTKRTPLVLNLHGFGSNGRQQALYSGFPSKADREGFILASPDGTGSPLHWSYPGLGGVDDVAFIRDLLDSIEADLCIDTQRVFVAGMSNGAAFAQIVACAMPDRITAVAAVAALVYPQRCGTDAPIAVIGFHGTDDPCVPFAGGTSACGQKLPVTAIEESAKNWASHDGCDIAPAEQQLTAHVRTIAYSRCKNETAVVLFVVEGGGHTWPGAIDVLRLGATTHEVNATDQIWEFFVAQGNLRASR
jgi:polyhydroxybutyrate depolymerase